MVLGIMLKYSIFVETERLRDLDMCHPLFLHRLSKEPKKNEKEAFVITLGTSEFSFMDKTLDIESSVVLLL